LKKKIQFLLNKPQLSENIGMSIRSLGCFGFDDINLINPKKVWPNDKGIRSSKHFESIAKKVKTFKSIPEAIAKSNMVIATSVRRRDLSIPLINFEDIEKLESKKITILFGQENNGLSNKEISYANYILTIPTQKNKSLNLSHSVALVAYMLSRPTSVSEEKIFQNGLKSEETEKFISYLMQLLKNRRFTTIKAKAENLELTLRSFIKSTNIDQKMLKTAYGIIKFITK
jgi:tRNA/rRNA methyltransferase